jgi:nucleoside-diphosphate-sugar epimerase/protoporphyrinogen oxidase
MTSPRIVVLGCGPTGLGAAHRLREKGHDAFRLFERSDYAGGLAASFTDPLGFVWDIGGHILFSRYDRFNAVSRALMGDDLLHHARHSYILMGGAFIPYPLQRNLQYLPEDDLAACMEDLSRAKNIPPPSTPPASYGDWLRRSFGEKLTTLFFEPYTEKVWICRPDEMSCQWVGERVADTTPDRILSNIARSNADIDWGPNATFSYPLHGGAGELWRRLGGALADHVELGKRCVSIDRARRRVHFADGSTADYDYLVSTMPLDELARCLHWDDALALARRLRHTSVAAYGFGMKGRIPSRFDDMMWLYFSEPEVPFYRCMFMSRLSPHNVPSGDYWSLVIESAYMDGTGRSKPGVSDVLEALLALGLVSSRDDVVDTWTFDTRYGYPIPTLDRDAILRELTDRLEAFGIYSRGRFGLWRYEVSNQDHSFMQGVEVVDHLLEGTPERVAKEGLMWPRGESPTPVIRVHASAAAVPASRRSPATVRGQRAMVWGASGFLGRHLVPRLLAEGAKVTVIVGRHGFASTPLPWHDEASWVCLDTMPPCAETLAALHTADVIYNLAGPAAVVQSNRDPLASLENICHAQLSFLETCRQADCKARVIFASTRLVYTPNGATPVTEETPVEPRSIYAAHKLCVEHYHQVFASMTGLTYAILRLSPIFGCDGTLEGNDHGIVNMFIKKGLRGEAITLFGDGSQLRDFIYVDDVVEALLAASTSAVARNVVLNVGGGEAIRLRDAAEAIRAMTDGPPIKYEPWPDEYARVESGDYVANVGKAREVLGVTPRRTFHAAVAQTLAAFAATL